MGCLLNPYLVWREKRFGCVFSVQVGPGLVMMDLSQAFLGKGLIIQTVTPLEPLLQHVVHQIYLPRNIPSFIAKLILWAEGVQVRGGAGGDPGGKLSLCDLLAPQGY